MSGRHQIPPLVESRKLIASVGVTVVYADGTRESVVLRSDDDTQIVGSTDLGYAPASDDDVGLLDVERMPWAGHRDLVLAVHFRGGRATYTPVGAS